MIKFYLLVVIYSLINNAYCGDNSTTTRTTTVDGGYDDYLSIIYMQPNDDSTIYTLNEKSTFGNDYINGWILPSDEKLLLNLYLYYNGTKYLNQLNKFLVSSTKHDANDQSSNHSSLTAHSTGLNNKLYLYFTIDPKQCDNYHEEQHVPIVYLDKLADNVYLVQINVRLPYSEKPFHICMQQINSKFRHQGEDYWLTVITTHDTVPLWLRIVVFIGLLMLSGLFSGLNLGLMSLDLSELEILKKIGTDRERSYASKIYPLRKRGNYLLCTILLGNVLVNSTSTLILGDLLSGIYAAFGSTILIVLFGEIIPQAACSKHGLAVGANTRFITYVFMILTFPVSFPLSKILDYILGKEIAATYNREKIRELLKNVKDLDDKEFKMVSGALNFNKRMVKDIMTSLEEVFMLDVNAKLDFATVADISQKGYSRIPVYEQTRENVIGLLHVKDFILLDPDDNMPVRAFLEFYQHKVIYCDLDDKLDQMFEKFRQGETHLAFVIQIIQNEDRDPYQVCVGIVTLEDVIEELVQMQIYDEFDDKKEIEKELEMEKLCQIKNSQSSINSSKSSNSSTSATSGKSSRSNKSDNTVTRNERKSISSSNSISLRSKKNKKQREATPHDDNNNQQDVKQNNALVQQTSVTASDKANFTPKYDQAQVSNDLTFFMQQSISGSALISPQLRLASFQFLSSTVKPFTNEFLTKNVLELIFQQNIFKEARRIDKSPPEYLYHYGKPCHHFIMIISGEATIEVGREKLEFIAGQFAYFAVNALLNDCENAAQVLHDTDIKPRYKQYIPDFSLRVDDKCVYLKIDRSLWRSGVKKSRYELNTGSEVSDSMDVLVNNLDLSKRDLDSMRDDTTANATPTKVSESDSNYATIHGEYPSENERLLSNITNPNLISNKLFENNNKPTATSTINSQLASLSKRISNSLGQLNNSNKQIDSIELLPMATNNNTNDGKSGSKND